MILSLRRKMALYVHSNDDIKLCAAMSCIKAAKLAVANNCGGERTRSRRGQYSIRPASPVYRLNSSY